MSDKNHAGSRNYYQDIVPGYEYMDIMEHVLGYEGVVAHLRGQIFKYTFRYEKKDAASSETVKISWYADRLNDVVKRYAAKDGSFPKKLRDDTKKSLWKTADEYLSGEAFNPTVVTTKVAKVKNKYSKYVTKPDPLLSYRPGTERE